MVTKRKPSTYHEPNEKTNKKTRKHRPVRRRVYETNNLDKKKIQLIEREIAAHELQANAIAQIADNFEIVCSAIENDFISEIRALFEDLTGKLANDRKNSDT